MKTTKNLKRYEDKKQIIDQIAKYSTLIIAIFFGAIFLSILVFLIARGVDGLADIFSVTKWDFVNNYGVLPVLVGSLFVTLFAILISLPISLCTSIIINEFTTQKMRIMLISVVEILAGIPSVIYGFFGVMFFVENGLLNYSVFLAALILAFMIVPNITHFINISLQTLPEHYRDASYALGANRIETIMKVLIPNIRSGIMAGTMIGLSRAIGETIAVTMLIGGTSNIDAHSFFADFFNSFLFAPNLTLSAVIANNFLEATKHQQDILYAIAIVLLLFVTIINFFALWIIRNRKKNVK